MMPPEPAATKGFMAGTHRLVAPEVTVERMRPLMSAMGITRIANVTGLDVIGVPVVMVTRPNARSLSVAQGKGPTLAAARASGLMEAIESYHAETITLPVEMATYGQLKSGRRLIDVTRLARYSHGSFHEAKPIPWIQGHDLISRRPCWLPYECVHTDFTVPLPAGSGVFVASSSGLASGNHRLEALTHGLCELVERDAVTLWHHAGPDHQAATRVDLESIDDDVCQRVLERYAAADIGVCVWDVTSDIGVPVFRAAIMEKQPNLQRPILPMGGFGCHPDRRIALLRALTEAAQSRVTTVAGSRDDMFHQRATPEAYMESWRWFQALRQAPGPRRRFGDGPSFEHANFVHDIQLVIRGLRAVGISEVCVVDLTQPEFQVPVVRVVVPGLEALHEIPGYYPGARARAVMARRGQASNESEATRGDSR